MPAGRAAEAWIQPQKFAGFLLDPLLLEAQLARAPREFTGAAKLLPLLFQVPTPDGNFSRFRIVESPVMAPELAAKFPTIRTYAGQGVDDPLATVRLDWTPAGFHAQVISPGGTYYVDPRFRGDTSLYSSYYVRDYVPAVKEWQCFVDSTLRRPLPPIPSAPIHPLAGSGSSLRKYRLAQAAQGEYTEYFGGTVTGAMAGIVTTINRVTGIYELDLAIRLELVANNDLIVFTNKNTDPYLVNDATSAILKTNQWVCDTYIGSANYDIGHVFNTGGGGLSYLGVVCDSSYKAQGCTGSSSPVGDPFDIDYVVHEMGHQCGADHTFNGTAGSCGGGNRNGPTAYEPGSGSTIMGYAGICGTDNLQAHSDPYFHFASHTQIMDYVDAWGTCSSNTSTGNHVPTVDAGTNYTIPRETPFVLTSAGSDSDSDPLTYSWEERDLGPAAALSAADDGAIPLFRVFSPTTNAWRTFPQMADLVGNTNSIQEKLPVKARTMKFRVVVRDNRSGGGGLDYGDMQIGVVTSAGPFRVTSPNTGVTWSGNQTITWDVANTALSPVSATNVNIRLSLDGGYTYPTVLASNTPNDGSQMVTLPSVATNRARIKVEATANIFFDISNTNFTITVSGNQPPVVDAGADQAISLPVSNVAMSATVTDDGQPSGITNMVWAKQSGPGAVTWTPSATVEDPTATFSSTGTYVLVLTADDGALTNSDTMVVTFTGQTNTLPAVDAGTNQSVVLPAAAALNASVTDDGLPGGVTNLLWSRQSGPGTVTFSPSAMVEDPTATFTNAGAYVLNLRADDGALTNSDTVTVTVLPAGTFFSEHLDADPGWTTAGQWAFGIPQGGGGSNDTDGYGFPDPTSGYTGTNVYGYNLAGNYPNNMLETAVTTPAINCSGYTNVTLKFRRWLSVEENLYDHAYLRVSNNGSTWSNVWQNPATLVDDGAWTNVQYNLSALADGRSTVYIRWVMGATDLGWRYCGWNIDDIELSGVSTAAVLHTLQIVTAHGTATPAQGTHTNIHGVTLTNTVSTTDTQGTTQYLNNGWVMPGNQPASGTSNTVVLTLTNSAVLTWTWNTNVQFTPTAGPNGSVTGAPGGWYPLGDSVTVTAVPAIYYHFLAWTGDVPAAMTNFNPLSVTMSQARAVFSFFGENLGTNYGTPESWLASFGLTNYSISVEELSDTDGDGMAAWQEWTAGTMPTNSGSALRAAGDSRLVSESYVIAWPSASNRVYGVFWGTNLESGLSPLATNLPATYPENTYTDSTHSTEPMLLYRIRVSKP